MIRKVNFNFTQTKKLLKMGLWLNLNSFSLSDKQSQCGPFCLGKLSDQWEFYFSFRHLYNLRSLNWCLKAAETVCKQTSGTQWTCLGFVFFLRGFFEKQWASFKCLHSLLQEGIAGKKTLSNCFHQNWCLLQEPRHKINNSLFWFIHCRRAEP